MWYVLQTLTGKEEELVRMIKKIVPCELYSDCFVAYYESCLLYTSRCV